MAVTRNYKKGADANRMTDVDYTAIEQYGRDWSAANEAGNQAGMQAAHDAAEALRAKYGYSGGADGSQYIKVEKTASPTDYTRQPKTAAQEFRYENAPDYVNKYQRKIDQLTSQILNREAFSYDQAAPEYTDRYRDRLDELARQIQNREPFSYDYPADPRWQAYRKQYAREGQRAAADVMGQYAAMTGGMPSTAAVTASQQAGDYYAAQLADRIPELYQLAYDMYLSEGNQQRANLDMLRGLRQDEYGRYLDQLGQYNTDRSFAYNVYADEGNRQLANLQMLQGLEQSDYAQYADRLAQYNQDRNFAYGQYRDNADDDYRDNAWNYSLAEAAYNRAWSQESRDYDRTNDALANQLELAQLGGQYMDYRGLNDLGIDTAKYEQHLAQAVRSGSRSGSRAGSTGGTERETTSAGPNSGGLSEAVAAYAARGGIADDYIRNHYKEYGFSSYTQARSALNEYTVDSKIESIDPRLVEQINQYAEGGMAYWDLAAVIRRWVEQGRLTQAQGDAMAATFQAPKR